MSGGPSSSASSTSVRPPFACPVPSPMGRRSWSRPGRAGSAASSPSAAPRSTGPESAAGTGGRSRRVRAARTADYADGGRRTARQSFAQRLGGFREGIDRSISRRERREHLPDPRHDERPLDDAVHTGEHDGGVGVVVQRCECHEQGLHRDAVEERGAGEIEHEMVMSLGDPRGQVPLQLRRGFEVEIAIYEDDGAVTGEHLAGNHGRRGAIGVGHQHNSSSSSRGRETGSRLWPRPEAPTSVPNETRPSPNGRAAKKVPLRGRSAHAGNAVC